MHILSRAVNFSLLAGPNPSEQKPNQTNKRLGRSYIAQRQQLKLGSCYFEFFCNGSVLRPLKLDHDAVLVDVIWP